MKRIAEWTWSWLRRCGLWLLSGVLVTWVVVNISAGPGLVVTDMAEAEGPQFSDVNTLDIVSDVQRRRACPAQTQRWVWRWTTYKGERAYQVVPLAGTEMPFFADDGRVILTLSSVGVPEPETGHWFYRSVTAEQCSFLPLWLSGLFGPRVFRSPDLPVNFVGAPHEGAKP